MVEHYKYLAPDTVRSAIGQRLAQLEGERLALEIQKAEFEAVLVTEPNSENVKQVVDNSNEGISIINTRILALEEFRDAMQQQLDEQGKGIPS